MPPSTSLAALRTAPSSLTAFHPRPSPTPPLLSRTPTTRWPPPLRARASGQPRGGSAPSDSALDALLYAAELLCLGPPAICSVVCAVRLALPSAPAKPALTFASGRVFVAQYAFLIAAVAIGSLIRRRQWGRLCRVGGGEAGELDLVGRIGKVEESVRGAVAAVGVLSRSVEKLGVRFRAMRRTLADPIMETATLAQKNSEATRILAAQEVILEKELGEIQKVLFAMQEQQQKQLQLILAIGEASRMLDGKQDTVRCSSAVPEMEKKEVKINAESINGGNNKP